MLTWLNRKQLWGPYGETIVGKTTSPFLRLRLRRMHGKIERKGASYWISNEENVRIDVIMWIGPGNPPEKRVKRKGRLPKGWVKIGTYKTEDAAIRRIEREAKRIDHEYLGHRGHEGA